MNVTNEFIRQIEGLGYRIKKLDDPNLIGDIYKGADKLCILFKNGEISTNAFSVLSKTLTNVKEYLEAFEEGNELVADGLRDGYKKLLEFNGYVLAMRKMGNSEYEFVTWQYSPDKKSVNLGRYFSDFESAKENMATRSSLINSSNLFNETELKLIYTNLIAYVGLNADIDYKSEKAIGNVLDKIEGIIPEITKHQEYERRELVSDDGLEL